MGKWRFVVSSGIVAALTGFSGCSGGSGGNAGSADEEGGTG
jgi:hypothetical protein